MNSLQRSDAQGIHRNGSEVTVAGNSILMEFKNIDGMQVVVRRALSGDFVCDYTREGENQRNITLLVAPNYRGQKLDAKKVKHYPSLSAFVFCDSPLHYARSDLIPYSEGPSPVSKSTKPPSVLSTDIAFLLNSKLENPHFKLTSEQSLAVLAECLGRNNALVDKVQKEEEVVIFLGNTGAGKSTLVNYLCGCAFEAVSPKKLGILHPDPSVIIVKSPQRGGTVEEVAPIGHTHSQTFMPQLVTLPNHSPVCDCPGFLSDRGFEINAASAINIKRVFQHARLLKIVIILSLETLMADRARGLKDLLNLCCGLFGSAENFLKGQSAVLLGITHIPPLSLGDQVEPVKSLQDSLKANNHLSPIEKQILNCLADRLFIYDPLNRSSLKYAGALQKEGILGKIHDLPAIKAAPEFFKTTLSDEDQQGIVQFCEVIHRKIQAITQLSELNEQDYKELGEHQKCLNGLLIIQHPTVNRSLAKIRTTIVSRMRTKVYEFNLLSYQENLEAFKQAQIMLKAIWDGVRYFDTETKQEVAALFKELPQNGGQSSQPAVLFRAEAVANALHISRMRDIIFASSLEVDNIEKRLAAFLKEFKENAEDLKQSLQSVVEQIQKEIKAGKLTGERMELAYMIFTLQKEMLEGIAASYQQHIELERQGLTVFGQELKNTLEVALYARLMEIHFIQETLKTVEKNQDREWTIAMQVHSQKVALEIQQYDQILRVRELERKQKQEDFARGLERIEQGIKEVHALHEHRLEAERIYHKHQTQMCRLQLQGAREMYNMDVTARLEIAALLKKHTPQTS